MELMKKIPSRLRSFQRHCEENGYELSLGDYFFIEQLLDHFDKNDFKAILSHYLKEWDDGMGKTENACHKQNFGRRQANLWLLNIFRGIS